MDLGGLGSAAELGAVEGGSFAPSAAGFGSTAGSAASAGSSLGNLAQWAPALAALTSVGSNVYGMTHGPSSPAIQQANPLQTGGTADLSRVLPSIRANAQARLGGGYSPNFLNNLYGQYGGPGQLQALQDVRNTLGQA